VTAGIDDFSAFYRRYAKDVFHFALHLSGNRSEAEDITSDTFERVWTTSATIDESTVRGFLFTIARNLYLQHSRKASRSVSMDDEIHDPAPDPYARAATRSDISAVQKRLMRLSEQDRAALLMRASHDLPYADIARSLKISVSSAKVKVHRARLALAGIR
jgi:RNA polymerase sigma-70 factor (ECF subfamily)